MRDVLDTCLDDCPICEQTDFSYDGPWNSDIPTTCTDQICSGCWQQIYDETDGGFNAQCPICDVDVSEWLLTHYPC